MGGNLIGNAARSVAIFREGIDAATVFRAGRALPAVRWTVRSDAHGRAPAPHHAGNRRGSRFEAVLLTLTLIKFKTDRSDLIDPNADFQKRWLSYTKSFGESSDIVVVVESEERETIPRVLDELGRRMESEPELFEAVLFKIDAGRVPAHKALQYLPSPVLEAGLQKLGDLRPFLSPAGNGLAVDSVFTHLSGELDRHRASHSSARVDRTLQQAERFASSLASSLSDPKTFQSPWPTVLGPPGGSSQRGSRNARTAFSPGADPNRPTYFLNEAGTIGFLKAFPKKESENFDGAMRSIDRLRQLAAEVARNTRRPASD